jgi:glycosyltransferase involved in cell wall biosynthesis
MKKIIFFRNFKTSSKVMGHHVKVHDYFMHCLHHPELEPDLYFTPESDYENSALWKEVPRERIIQEIQLERDQVVFISGKDWELLPQNLDGQKVIHIVQHVKVANPDNVLFKFLSRPAFRICVSPEVQAAIAPYANGETVVINNGVSLETFRPGLSKKSNSILIWARKNPRLGHRLHKALRQKGIAAKVLIEFLPRHEFARQLGDSDIFVALPNRTEGFYLPALEGMASGCAVICSDNIGNRGFCRRDETCLMPDYDDEQQHLDMIESLLANPDIKESIRRSGMEVTKSYSLDRERALFYRFLEKYIL